MGGGNERERRAEENTREQKESNTYYSKEMADYHDQANGFFDTLQDKLQILEEKNIPDYDLEYAVCFPFSSFAGISSLSLFVLSFYYLYHLFIIFIYILLILLI